MRKTYRFKRILCWVLASFGAIFLLLIVLLHFAANGDIPEIMDANDIAYEKVLGIQPTSGSIWYAGLFFVGNGPCYVRIHLSQQDFDKTEIAKYHRLGKSEKPDLRGPIWWNPASDSQFYSAPSITKGWEDFYAYDAKRGLLFAERN